MATHTTVTNNPPHFKQLYPLFQTVCHPYFDEGENYELEETTFYSGDNLACHTFEFSICGRSKASCADRPWQLRERDR